MTRRPFDRLAEAFVWAFYYHRPLGNLVRCGSFGRDRRGVCHLTVHVGRRWHSWHLSRG